MEQNQFEYRQTAFEDLPQIHLLITTQPEEFYKMYYRLHEMFTSEGHDNPQSLAMTMMAFPYKGKEYLSEDEIVEAVQEIQAKLAHGFFKFN